MLAHSYLTVLDNPDGTSQPMATTTTAAATTTTTAAVAVTATTTAPGVTSSQDVASSQGASTAIDMMAKVSLGETNPNQSMDSTTGNADGATNSNDTVRGRRTDVSSSSKRR